MLICRHRLEYAFSNLKTEVFISVEKSENIRFRQIQVEWDQKEYFPDKLRKQRQEQNELKASLKAQCHKKLELILPNFIRSKHKLKVERKEELKVYTGSKRIFEEKKQRQERNGLKARLSVIKSSS